MEVAQGVIFGYNFGYFIRTHIIVRVSVHAMSNNEKSN